MKPDRHTAAAVLRHKVIVQAVAGACMVLSATAYAAPTSSCTKSGAAQTIARADVGTCNLATNDSVTITSAGSIGIAGSPASLNAGITNWGYGTGGITINTGGSINITSNSWTWGIGVTAGATVTGSITNNGTIAVNSTSPNYDLATGINVSSGASVTGSITNTGTITATTGASSTANAYGIEVSNAAVTGGVTNSGTITVTNAGSGTAKGLAAETLRSSGSTSVGSITNSGTITATTNGNGEARGISIENNASSATLTVGAVTNSGSITATSAGTGAATGLVISNYSTGSATTGAITNSGSISGVANGDGNAYGVGIDGGWGSVSVDSISNTGTLSGVSHGAGRAAGLGISSSGAAITVGAVSNKGTIAAATDGSNDAYGIGIVLSGKSAGSVNVASVTNSGSITAVTNGSGHAYGYAQGVYSGSASIGSVSVGGLTNTGTIAATSYGSGGAFGVALGGAGYSGTAGGTLGAIVNSGTISATSNSLSSGIAVGTVISGQIGSNSVTGLTNTATGVISAQAKAGSAYGLILLGYGKSISGTTVHGIDNAGTISGVTQNGTGFGIYAQGAADIGWINNSGTIKGSTFSLMLQNYLAPIQVTNSGTLEGTAAIGFNTLNLTGDKARVIGDVQGFLGKGVSGSGTVNVQGKFTAEGNFFVPYFNVAAGATFNSNHNEIIGYIDSPAEGVSGGDPIIAGQEIGRLTALVTNSGTFAVGAGSTSIVSGNYLQTATGVFQTTVASATSYGKLAVAGNVDLSASNKIFVNVLNGAALSKGTTLSNVINAGGTLTVGPLAVTDNSALYDFSGVVNGKAIDLVAAPAVLNAVQFSSNDPATGAAKVLDAIVANGGNNDEMNKVIEVLSTLPTKQELSKAVTQTLPLLFGGMNKVAFGSMTSTNRVIQARMDGNRGMSSGDAFSDRNLWVKPFASRARQSDRDGIAGYEATTYGFVIGADGALTNADRLGVALAYSHSNVDGSSTVARNTGDVQSYQALVYGSHAIDERTELSFQADVGLNRNGGSRSISFGSFNTVAQANYDSDAFHIGLGIGRSYPLGEATTLLPSFRVDFTSVKDQGYTETGAGALNLTVDSRKTETLVWSLDGKLAQKLNERSLLTAKLGLGYDSFNRGTSVTSNYVGGGAAFATPGIKSKPVIVTGGLGLAYTTPEGATITAGYDVEARESFTNQTASVKFRMPF